MLSYRAFSLSLLLATGLSGCATIGINIDSRTERVQAREVRQVLKNEPAGAATSALRAAQSRSLDEKAKLAALIETARLALQNGDPAVYNAAVGQVVTALAESDFTDLPPNFRLVLTGPHLLDPLQADTLNLASSVRLKGLLSRATQTGYGVPYVAWFRRGSPFLAGQPGVPPPGMALPVTAILTFRAGVAHLCFQKTLEADHTLINGQRHRLAADFSAPIGILFSHGKNRSIDIEALFLTKKYFGKAGLIQVQPYDPQKIPVVFVHGLVSRPEAWTQALNGLLADPMIRERYQFWFYQYPTGLPVWTSAAVLRKELDRYHRALDPRGRNPRFNRMVLVGHSMGGLISSLLVRDGGDRLWRQFSDVSPHDLRLSAEAKKEILQTVYFEPRKDVARVVFISTPHRGSDIAVHPVVGFISTLIQLPINALTENRSEILPAIRDDMRGLFVAPVNSLVFLRAKSPLLLSILNLPLARIPYHSIIGDRGRGNSPQSSDGVVPYWSSHLDGAVSEKIVPTNHGANENARGIEELRRILIENLETR